MPICKAHPRWEGSVRDGKGAVSIDATAHVMQALAGTDITLEATLRGA